MDVYRGLGSLYFFYIINKKVKKLTQASADEAVFYRFHTVSHSLSHRKAARWK